MTHHPTYDELARQVSRLEEKLARYESKAPSVPSVSAIQEEGNADEHFRQIYENMTVGIARVNLDFTIQSANRAYCSMLGYTEAELIGKHIQEIAHPETVKANLEQQKRLSRCEISHYRMEKSFIHKDGHKVCGILDANLVRDRNGRPAYFLGTVSDISHLKKVEAALEGEKRLLTGVLDSIKDIIGVQLPDRTVIQYNRAGYEFLGLGPDQVIGKKCHELFGRAIPCEICPTALVYETRTIQTLEKLIPETGRFFQCTANPILDEKGEIRLVIEQLCDITDRKKLDERLRQSQKMESVGDLAGGIAHDFNNLLFPIMGNAELLLEDLGEDSPEHESAAEILQAAQRGSRLVKQILAFSRRSETRKAPLSCSQVIKEALELIRATIPADIEIIQTLSDDCGPVMADATQIHQIIMNLITNAFHAVQETGGTIRIELAPAQLSDADPDAPELAPGPYALIRVSDNGTGMTQETQEKIFDPYFTTKGPGKGTGLGLAVVYGLVHDHDGDIQVNSRPGHGSCFSVWLPVIREAEKSCSKAVPSGPVPQGSGRVLLVDDQPAVVRIEKQMLERSGFKVETFTDSREALDRFRQAPDQFDLVLSDMTMPGITGDRLALELTRIRKDIPVIIATGFSERLDPDKAEAMGISAVLMKPLVRSEMTRTINQVLSRPVLN